MGFHRIAAFVGCLPLLTGCAIVGAEPVPPAAGNPPLCLERRATDERNLAALIDAALREEGVPVTLVAAEGCDETSALHVVYTDTFGWDMRVYLLRLTVEIVDSRSGESLAIGESCQPSLAALGDSYEDVVGRAVQALIGEKDS